MSPATLKLDDLFGISNPLNVERGGKTYELKRPEALTLKENVEWRKVAKSLLLNYGAASKMQNKGAAKDDDVQELAKSMDACLKLICPAILDEDKPLSLVEKISNKLHPERFEARAPFSFAEKLSVLEFYQQQVFAKSAPIKVNKNPSRKGGSGMQKPQKH